jgi:hypothetical protein
MRTVVETRQYARQAADLFSTEEQAEIIDFVARNPDAGDEIPGTGGVRKIRFGFHGRGKRGGARVIYYWHNDDVPIFMIAAYAKNQKTDLRPDELKAVAAIAEAIKRRARTAG